MATKEATLLEALGEVLQIVEDAHYKCDLSTDDCYDGMAPGEHAVIRRAHEAIERSETAPQPDR